jgi:hypothetical protein
LRDMDFKVVKYTPKDGVRLNKSVFRIPAPGKEPAYTMEVGDELLREMGLNPHHFRRGEFGRDLERPTLWRRILDFFGKR